jgi:hypothetical protein
MLILLKKKLKTIGAHTESTDIILRALQTIYSSHDIVPLWYTSGWGGGLITVKSRFSLPSPGHCWPGRACTGTGTLWRSCNKLPVSRCRGWEKGGGRGVGTNIDIYNFYLNYLTGGPTSRKLSEIRENFYVDVG